MLELVASEMGSEACRESEGLQAFYRNTLAHVRHQKEAGGGDLAARYAAVHA